jgi:pheromone a factor receptor
MTSLVSWYILLNIFNIINSLVWPNDDLESAWDGTGLCDIEVKMMVGGYFAVPGALVGIFRGLAIVLDTSRATMVPSRKQRWRNRIMDILFCCLLPAISMALHIIWQKDRYLLYAISGCVVDLDESWVSFALCFVWPPVICFVAAFYCCSSHLDLEHIREF